METLLRSYGHTCTHLGILISGEVAEKQELRNALVWGESSFHVMLDLEVFTHAKNEK